MAAQRERGPIHWSIEGLADDIPDPLETERRRAFVAVDLRLERRAAAEVPFQELAGCSSR